MRNAVVLGALVGVLALLPAVATAAAGGTDPGVTAPAAKPVASWAAPQIEAVLAAGVMKADAAGFRPDDPFLRSELYDALVALGRTPPEPADPDRAVTIRELDAQLVSALGALPAARAIRQAALTAGLQPTAMLGTETVARLLGLRFNHPQGREELERSPRQPASRAEAAYSLARVLSLPRSTVQALIAKTATIAFPELADPQREVLARAFRLVGNPYVFAGMSEKPQRLWSASAAGGTIAVPGGFDCSGFVWRVYKLEPLATAPLVGEVLKGRTSYAMSGEVAPAARIALADLAPGDLIFFGSEGPRSRPAQVGHMGLNVGNGWFVHSSGNGVTLQPFEGWYLKTFAWGRRPLAEAGVA
jgi:cell wall-associated NlpC family hydrolase